MSDPVKGRRAYDSTRRREQARQTQLDVLHAARDLFVSQGYGRTTVADVARAAGVSVETVYGAFRTKAALLHRVWDITIGGDDEDVVYHERPEVRALRAEPDLEARLRGHAVLYTATSRRIVPFMLAIQGAASADVGAADLLAEIGRQRYEGMGVLAREAVATGQLAVSEDECHDVMWSLTDGTLWHRLVNERGWSDERFAGWLGETWVRLLVRPS